MRLFTGIALDPTVLNNLGRVMRELRPLAPLKWSPLENLHITSKFIGAWPAENLETLKQALGAIVRPAAFPVTVAGFRYFPDPHHPRMLFAGVQAGGELGELAKGIEDALEPLGVARESRPYTPHLTLARIGNKSVRDVREYIANMKNPDFGTFEAAGFHLYESTPGGSGSVYTTLATFPLGLRA
jgi:2'-5' RNA ligase